MNKTKIIGSVLLLIGFTTSVNFYSKDDFAKSLGLLLSGMGLFLLWNGYVADYNNDIGFAIFG